jgi:hypothetical protein
MPNLPDVVRKAWDHREGPIILATVDGRGTPNAIYAGAVAKYSDSILVVADNYLDKTRRNILNGCRGAMLFMTADKKAYQVKGRLERHTSGPIFDDMKKWNPPKHPGHAAIALTVEEAYQGATKLL